MLHENLNDRFETFFRLEFSLPEDCLAFTNSFIWVEKPSARISILHTPNWEGDGTAGPGDAKLGEPGLQEGQLSQKSGQRW